MNKYLSLLPLLTVLISQSLFSEPLKLDFSLYRHATFVLNIDGKKILVDPMFAGQRTYPPVQLSDNNKMNPLVDFPIDYNDLLDADGVIITHNHFDHFDEVAKRVLPKDIPILCQPSDSNDIMELGFTNVTSVNKMTSWMSIGVNRFKGTHGGGLFNKLLGQSSSYLLTIENCTVFITGDTQLNRKQKALIKSLYPDFIIAYGGRANIKLAGQLTMGLDDILTISEILPESQIIAVHMDSINHCSDTRSELMKALENNHHNVIIPNDNETVSLLY